MNEKVGDFSSEHVVKYIKFENIEKFQRKKRGMSIPTFVLFLKLP